MVLVGGRVHHTQHEGEHHMDTLIQALMRLLNAHGTCRWVQTGRVVPAPTKKDPTRTKSEYGISAPENAVAGDMVVAVKERTGELGVFLLGEQVAWRTDTAGVRTSVWVANKALHPTTGAVIGENNSRAVTELL